MPATRKYVPADDAPPAPCDLGCWWWWRCHNEKLACQVFERFVNDPYEKRREPPTTWNCLWSGPQQMPATRKTYETIFKIKGGKISKCS